MGLATSPTKVTAIKTGSGRDAQRGPRNRTSRRGDSGLARTKTKRPRRGTISSRLLSSGQAERFGTWNVRTLRGLGKLEQLTNEMERYKVAVLAVTETHLTETGQIVMDEMKGYRMLLSGRQDNRAAEGVGLALAPHAFAALRHYQAVSPRILMAEFLTKVGPLSVIVVYAPTDQSSTEDKDLFYRNLELTLNRGNGLAIIMGDFNATISETVQGVVGPHGLGRRTTDNGERLVSFASTNGLCITSTMFSHKRIHQATWYPPNPRAEPSLKDYVLVRRRLRPSVLDTRACRGADIDSDHRLVVLSLRLKLQRKVTKRPRNLFDAQLCKEEARRMGYMEDIRAKFESRKQQGSIEERWEELREAVTTCAEQHLQGKRRPKKPWISEDTLLLIETKRMAFVEWQEDRTDADKRKEYVARCRQVRWAVKCDRERWWDALLSDMENDLKRNRQGDFFKKMKRLSGNKVTPIDTILDESGQLLDRNEDKLARWRRHFEKVLNVDNDVSEEVLAGVVDNSDMEVTDVTREEVEKAVVKLKNGKAPGSDRIVAELLKNGGEAMVDWLTELVQEVWKTGQVPQEWKNATLVPLFKKKDRRVCDNYRGISLLSVPGKVLALILLERLHPIIDPQLMETQCGFRKGRGTVDQLWVIRQVAERATEYRTPLLLCFVDLAKAYDSVNRQALIAILKEYRVPQQLARIVEELHTDTRCQIRTAGGTSEEFDVNTGVRQGCVLSPLLFNCFMDKILREATKTLGGGLHINYTTEGGVFLTYRNKTPAVACIQDVLYADDLALVAETRRELQSMVNVLDSACTRWGMTISAGKTKVLAIGEIQPEVQSLITLKGQALEEVKSFSYLGSMVGQDGKVEEEVAVRLGKAGIVYQLWRKKVFRSHSLSKETKLRAFRTLVMSVLLYGAETWAVSQRDLNKLRTFQMRCLRDILGLTLWDKVRNTTILERTGELPVEQQLRQRRLQWFGHVWRMPAHRPQRQVLRCRPSGRKRPPGGTALRWCDLLNNDLKGVRNWVNAIEDRAEWRATIHANQPRRVPLGQQHPDPAQRP